MAKRKMSYMEEGKETQHPQDPVFSSLTDVGSSSYAGNHMQVSNLMFQTPNDREHQHTPFPENSYQQLLMDPSLVQTPYQSTYRNTLSPHTIPSGCQTPNVNQMMNEVVESTDGGGGQQGVSNANGMGKGENKLVYGPNVGSPERVLARPQMNDAILQMNDASAQMNDASPGCVFGSSTYADNNMQVSNLMFQTPNDREHQQTPFPGESYQQLCMDPSLIKNLYHSIYRNTLSPCTIPSVQTPNVNEMINEMLKSTDGGRQQGVINTNGKGKGETKFVHDPNSGSPESVLSRPQMNDASPQMNDATLQMNEASPQMNDARPRNVFGVFAHMAGLG